MYQPTLDEFVSLAGQGNLIPLYREILADMETPVSAFRKIDDGQTAFRITSYNVCYTKLLRCQKSFWKFVGILTLVMTVVALLGIAAAILVPTLMSGR